MVTGQPVRRGDVFLVSLEPSLVRRLGRIGPAVEARVLSVLREMFAA